MMRQHAVLFVLLLPVVQCACGGDDAPAPPDTPAPTPAHDTPAETPPQETAAPEQETPEDGRDAAHSADDADTAQGAKAGAITAPVQVVDLYGEPLPGMAPIACTEPNAFQKPLRTGPLTNDDGRSEVTFPGNRMLYLRAWDPDLRYFSNNYQTYLGTGAPVQDTVELVMAEGVHLTATLATPDHQPLAEQEARLLMAHPTQGPWWPARAETDAHGAADFGTVPAGRFLLEVRAQDGIGRQLPETDLLPGRDVDLGLVVLE
ncbi:MAG: hypothetical protein ACLFTT_16340 [Candidatus Hydrogenedentota bacterium]